MRGLMENTMQNGLPALIVAAHLGNLTWAKRIVANGGNPNVSSRGANALHEVLFKQDIAFAKWLLSLEAIDVNAPTSSTTRFDGREVPGWTPLMITVGCKNPDLELISLLIARGACPKPAGYPGPSIYDYIISRYGDGRCHLIHFIRDKLGNRP